MTMASNNNQVDDEAVEDPLVDDKTDEEEEEEEQEEEEEEEEEEEQQGEGEAVAVDGKRLIVVKVQDSFDLKTQLVMDLFIVTLAITPFSYDGAVLFALCHHLFSYFFCRVAKYQVKQSS